MSLFLYMSLSLSHKYYEEIDNMYNIKLNIFESIYTYEYQT